MSDFSDLQILIVEDEPYDSDVLASIMQMLKIQYHVMSDGLQMMDVLDELVEIDVIFLDLDLPTLTGYEVFDILKADSRVSHIPIIAYSSHANEMNYAYKKGFQGFMAKPVNILNFADNLSRILNGGEVWE